MPLPLVTLGKLLLALARHHLPVVYRLEMICLGAFLVVQWLRRYTCNAEQLGMITGQGTRSHMPQLRPSAAK